MKPISFENLRRLVGGGKKKKEKESFKRSDSFKRISIRKSYLDRGKKKHLQKLEVATQTVAEEVLNISVPSNKVDSGIQVQEVCEAGDARGGVVKHEEREGGGPGQSVIAYGQWLKGICKDDLPPSGFKGAERTVIYIPASDEDKIPSPVIRQLSSSPVLRKKSPYLRRKVSTSPQLQRKESNDSAVEMFPWGDSSEIKKSPLIKRRTKQNPKPLLPDSGSEEICSLSISLGRIWMDAPPGMTPRSLEMPKSGMVSPPAHHSLDSALKDLREDHIVINRLQKRPTAAVSRTLSSTSNATTTSTGLFSSKDSGFSFSVSATKLSSFSSSKKKKQKPKLSVSRDGYFKRTSGVLVETHRSSIKRKSSRKKKNRSSGRYKRNKNNTSKSELYQVVVSRPSRSLRSLKLDPMIFVPPEKRRVPIKRKQSFKVGMREIRNFNPLSEAMYSTKIVNGSADEGLYESLPGEGDYYCFDEQPLSGRISRISLREDDYDFPSNDFVSNTPEKSTPTTTVVISDDISESDEYSLSSESLQQCSGVSPVPKRRPVRRRKSGLSRKRSVTYVAKPSVVRAPSTLRRPIKKSGKHLHLLKFKKRFVEAHKHC